MFFYAGLVIFGAGIFDMVDGRVARAHQPGHACLAHSSIPSSIATRDVALFFGLLVYYARANRFLYVVLAAFVMVTSLMVSYTRARAEALIGSCKVGFMERPERIVLVILMGALFNHWSGWRRCFGYSQCSLHHGDSPHHLYLPEHEEPGAVKPGMKNDG